jgi:diguanylate cyclase (GGDEF)-like protein/PAS domain S-box-containing protein
MTFTPGLWLFILAALILVGLLGISWQFRGTHTGKAFLLLITCALIWVVGFSFETAADTLGAKLILANIQFAGLSFIPNAWLYLAVSYRGRTLPLRTWILLVSLPIATNLLIWADPLLHWFRGTPFIDTSSAPFPVLVNDYQFWFYFVHAPSGYVFILAAVLVITRGFRNIHGVYRSQTLLLLSALLLPVFTDLLYVLGYSPIKYYNITPAIFSLSALLIAWDLFRFQFLDLRPLARDLIIENLRDGIIVLDHKNRIVDFNPAAKRIAKLTTAAIGKQFQDLRTELLVTLDRLKETGEMRTEIQIGENPSLYYELQFSEIRNPTGHHLGRVVTLRDSTERVELFHKVEHAATHDGLTGIFNRQRFSELAEHELRRARSFDNHSISILMFDLDRFKQINDNHGHDIGDKALIKVARKCQQILRPTDIFGRIGGDEFAAILVDGTQNGALKAAERLRRGIETISFSAHRERIRLTSSFGIYTSLTRKDDFSEILKKVDQAMYRAKQSGGNRIVNFETLAD